MEKFNIPFWLREWNYSETPKWRYKKAGGHMSPGMVSTRPAFTAATLEKTTKGTSNARGERHSGGTRSNQQQKLRGVLACEVGEDQESTVSCVQDSVLRRKWLWDPVPRTGQWHED